MLAAHVSVGSCASIPAAHFRVGHTLHCGTHVSCWPRVSMWAIRLNVRHTPPRCGPHASMWATLNVGHIHQCELHSSMWATQCRCGSSSVARRNRLLSTGTQFPGPSRPSWDTMSSRAGSFYGWYGCLSVCLTVRVCLSASMLNRLFLSVFLAVRCVRLCVGSSVRLSVCSSTHLSARPPVCPYSSRSPCCQPGRHGRRLPAYLSIRIGAENIVTAKHRPPVRLPVRSLVRPPARPLVRPLARPQARSPARSPACSPARSSVRQPGLSPALPSGRQIVRHSVRSSSGQPASLPAGTLVRETVRPLDRPTVRPLAGRSRQVRPLKRPYARRLIRRPAVHQLLSGYRRLGRRAAKRPAEVR